MKSVLDLQIAILEDDDATVRELLSEIDKRTESAMFSKAAAHFEFKTVEHHGRQFAMRREIATLMGYKDESGLRKLCERHDLESVSLGTFGQNVRDIAVKELGLKRNDGKTMFIGWDAFLLFGMQGTSSEAKKIRLYLLNMEKAARIAGGSVDLAKAHQTRIGEADKVVTMISRAERIQNAELKARTFLYLDKVLDGALEIPEQVKLFKEE